jgi:hypothetical protein
MNEEDRDDWAMLDEIIDELKETMPHDTEEELKALHEEARKRFAAMLDGHGEGDEELSNN